MFSAMMMAETRTASTVTQRGAASSPIFARLAVNMTSGTMAKGS